MVKKLEIDQSVRIEELTKDTVLGIANEQVSFTVIIPKKVKRVLYEKFRCQGKPKKFAPYVFATAISKKSPAHFAAYGVYIGRKKADHRISITKLLEILEGIKK